MAIRPACKKSNMPFRIVGPVEFDHIVVRNRVRDEHELLESRFFDASDRLIGRVIRQLDDQGELLPEATLEVATGLDNTTR